MTAEDVMRRVLDGLDEMARGWAAEVGLSQMVAAVDRDREKIYALVLEAFVEGAYRGRTSHHETTAERTVPFEDYKTFHDALMEIAWGEGDVDSVTIAHRALSRAPREEVPEPNFERFAHTGVGMVCDPTGAYISWYDFQRWLNADATLQLPEKTSNCERCNGSGLVPAPGGVTGETCACGRCGGTGVKTALDPFTPKNRPKSDQPSAFDQNSPPLWGAQQVSCVYRSGCKQPEVCQTAGHCVPEAL